MIVFRRRWLYFGKSGFIWAKVVEIGKKLLYWVKLLVFDEKWLYSCKGGCIWTRWLYSRKMVLFGQKGL